MKRFSIFVCILLCITLCEAFDHVDLKDLEVQAKIAEKQAGMKASLFRQAIEDSVVDNCKPENQIIVFPENNTRKFPFKAKAPCSGTAVAHMECSLMDPDMKVTYKDIKEAVVSIFAAWNVFAEKFNIDWFLYGGTLLGQFRGLGFIPFDNDGDIGILWEDVEKIRKINGSELYIQGTDGRNFLVDLRENSDICVRIIDTYTSFYVDGFCFFNRRTYDHIIDSYRIASRPEPGWLLSPFPFPPNVLLRTKDVFPTRRCLFERMLLRCPNNPFELISMSYASWSSPEIKDIKWNDFYEGDK